MKVSKRDTIDRYYLFSWRGWGLFLHRIKKDDPSPFHSHPWSWASLIFGSYVDHRFVTGPGPIGRERWFINWCAAGVPHRVTLPRGPVWTLCLHAPRSCKWAVYDWTGKLLEEEPWRGVERPERTSYVR